MLFGLAARFTSVLLAAILLPAQAPVVAQPGAIADEHPIPTSTPPSASKESPREDWATISLAKSGLPVDAIGGVMLSKVELPECTRELLRVQWRQGDPIDLYVIRPRGAAKPPVALYLFDYTADIDLFREETWCRQAGQTGIAAVGFVSALSGQRFHAPRPLSQWFVSELQEALSTTTHDVQMVLNYLASRNDLDMNRVGMFGQGSGGTIAILAAAADPRIVVLDVVDPWGDWPDWIKDSRRLPTEERTAYLKPEFLQKIANLDPVIYLPRMKGKVLRIQQLMDDSITTATARDKIAGAAPKPGETARYQDRSAQAKTWGANGFSGWLAEKLKPAGDSIRDTEVISDSHLQPPSATDEAQASRKRKTP
jgi:hypothetical protein